MKAKLQLILLLFFPFICFSQESYFPPIGSDNWETMSPEELDWCPERIDSLVHFLDNKNTKAFIVLKNGKIVLEEYFDDFTQDSLWYWASAGKTMTSFLVGLTQQAGLLDINNPTSDYLGSGWTSLTDNQEAAITVRHQLSMTTGMDDGGGNSDCTDPDCLVFLDNPGDRWSYHNAPYTLLTNVIENTTGLAINQVVNSQVNNKIGMSGGYVPLGDLRVFFSKPRSMARFGLLIANNGVWDTDSLMTDQNYFNAMVSSSQDLNQSYGYLWWLNGKGSYMLPSLQNVFNSNLVPDAPSDMFAALGKNDQKIYVVPSQDLVVIRMGNSSDISLLTLSNFDNSLWVKINELVCDPSSTSNRINDTKWDVFPNPVNDVLYLKSKSIISPQAELTVIDVNGRRMLEQSYSESVDVRTLVSGAYYLEIRMKDGIEFIPFIKQ